MAGRFSSDLVHWRLKSGTTCLDWSLRLRSHRSFISSGALKPLQAMRSNHWYTMRDGNEAPSSGDGFWSEVQTFRLVSPLTAPKHTKNKRLTSGLRAPSVDCGSASAKKLTTNMANTSA